MTKLPALARRSTAAPSLTPTLDAPPHRWLAVALPDRYSRLPTIAEEAALRRELVAANAPVSVDDLEHAIMRMVGAFPQRGPTDSRPYILALAEHLAEYPADVVEAACRRIVRTSRYLPAVAEVVEIAEELVERRRFALHAVNAIPAERERRREAEEREREQREANARWSAASERARLRLTAAARPGDIDRAWHRLSASHRIALTCAAQQGDDALDAAVAELIAGPVTADDLPGIGG